MTLIIMLPMIMVINIDLQKARFHASILLKKNTPKKSEKNMRFLYFNQEFNHLKSLLYYKCTTSITFPHYCLVLTCTLCNTPIACY